MSTVAERSAARKRAQQQKQALDWVDDRLGSSSWLRSAMDKIFPDHWSFMVGEIAMYSFVILIVTGIYLALFYKASDTLVIYHGVLQAARRPVHNRGLRIDDQPLLQRAGWPGHAPGPPLGCPHIPGRSCVPHVPRILHRGLPSPAGNQLDHRGHPADAGHAGGFLGLLAA